MKLESIVKSELDKLKISIKKNFIIEKYSEVYPKKNKEKDSYLIQIRISDTEKPRCSEALLSLDFWYHSEKRTIEVWSLDVHYSLREKGYGKKLVKMMEKTGKKLECSKSIFMINLNPDFWEHMGYKQVLDYWEKQI